MADLMAITTAAFFNNIRYHTLPAMSDRLQHLLWGQMGTRLR